MYTILISIYCKIMVMNVNDPNEHDHHLTYEEKSFQLYDLEGIDFKIVLSGKQTGEKYSLLEINFSAGKEKEIPLHKHSRETLIIYIMEGNFLFRYGDQNVVGEANAVLKFEKNIPHSYRKTGQGNGRLLILYIPAGFENFINDIRSTRLDSKEPSEKDQVLLHLLEKKYGGRFVFE